MEFDLNEIVNDTEKAFKVKRQIEAAFKQLTESSTLAMATAKETKDLNEKLHDQVKELTTASINLNQAMRDIHTLLHSKRDLWKEDKEMVEFMNSFGTWILSSGSIKLQVVGNASDNK